MSKRRWSKFTRERSKGGGRSSSESEEEIPVTKTYDHSRSSNKDNNSIKRHISSEARHSRDPKDRPSKSHSSKSSEDTRSNRETSRLDERTEHSKSFGPSLPPELARKSSKDTRNNRETSTLDERTENSKSFGPSLPPELAQKSSNRNQDVAGPSLPTNNLKSKCEVNVIIGPTLPPHLIQPATEEVKKSVPAAVEDVVVGPTLPPHLQKKFEDPGVDMIGPAIPAHLLTKVESSPQDVAGPSLPPNLMNTVTRKVIGPSLPPGFTAADSSSDEDIGVVGPDLRLMATGESSAAAELDERAARAKRKMLGLDKEEKKERESWMLELPPEKASIIGLGPRQFRQKLAPEMGDRSIWTDLPADTARKESLPPKLDDKSIIKQKKISERDRIMEKLAKKAEKKLKREESLLDMHRSKMKKKAKEEEKERQGQPAERKRFNREEDMQVHRFDEAQKKAIFKRAQLLNDRFSKGESKYL